MGLNPSIKTKAEPSVVNEKGATEIEYDKPKILLLDLQSGDLEALADLGFNVRDGSFGLPYKVPMGSNFQPLISTPRLPNFAEQEIVVVDLQYEAVDQAVGERARPNGEHDLWSKCDSGFIDPRSRATKYVQSAFNKVLEAGGVFVVFAATKTNNEIKIGSLDRYERFNEHQNWPYSEWSFLEVLDDMQVSNESGEEMSITDDQSAIGKLLKLHLQSSEYDCTLKGGFRGNNPWEIIASNKFGNPVALKRACGPKGHVLILPQLKDKTGFLKALFTNVLPEMAPHLFPGIEKGRWTHLVEYELPKVIQLEEQRIKLEEKFKADLAILE